MELALSLSDTAKPLAFLDRTRKMVKDNRSRDHLGFCIGLGGDARSQDSEDEAVRSEEVNIKDEDERRRPLSESDPPLQLDLLPFSPVPRKQTPSQLRFPWLTDNILAEPGSSSRIGKGLDVNREPTAAEGAEDWADLASPNSTVSPFQMDFSIYTSSGRNKRGLDHSNANEAETEIGASSRASDEDENGLSRKKLRLTKDQSAFLEESFKEHNTLNPKQKLALAKQLNLRPRQVEVWFQNRRARTKLKQTEVDCEYLKRCCETLTEENRRLQKELQELRALKSSQPFYMQLPATTLTMCPSCERVASTSTTNTSSLATTTTTTTATPCITASAQAALTLSKPRLYQFSHATVQTHQPATT